MKQLRLATVLIVLNLIGLGALAAGRIAQLPLDKQTKTSHGVSCTYLTTLDMGEISDLNPIQVFTLFQGKYHLLVNQPSLTPENNGRVSLFLSSYKEVASDETCPAHAELLIVR